MKNDKVNYTTFKIYHSKTIKVVLLKLFSAVLSEKYK